jgi:hypothetical protein
MVLRLLLVLSLLLPYSLFGDGGIRYPPGAGGGGGGGGNPCAGYLVCQNFETASTGYDNGETWVVDSATIDPVYTTTILRGTQSLHGSGGNAQVHTTFANQSDVWMYCLIRFISFTSANGITFRFQDNPVTKNLLCLQLNNTGTVSVFSDGSSSSNSACTLSTGTTYSMWMHFVAGGTSTLYMSTTTTRPSSDDATHVVVTINGVNVPAGLMSLYFNDSNAIADHVLVSSSAIGDNP